MSFDNPYCLLLIFLPLLVRKFAPAYKRKNDSIYVTFFPIIRMLKNDKFDSSNTMQERSKFQKSLILLSWIALVIALCKPVLLGQEIKQTIQVRDFIIALDLSGSMNSKDSSGRTRLDVAKKVLTDFIKTRQKDRIGLIVFGDAAFTLSSVTNDHQTLIEQVNDFQVGMAGQGTHIGDALGLGVKMLEDSVAKEKIVILFTDGNDTNSAIPPIEAAKLANSNNVRIYPIAFGDPEDVGENPLDLLSLEVIARETGASYFLAKNEDELNKSYERLNEIEPSEVEVKLYTPKIDIFYYFLIPVFVIYILFFGFSLIKKNARLSNE